jgi:hypothetical protein
MFKSSRYSQIYDNKRNQNKNYASSRLAKKEKSKVEKQTFYYLFFGVAILLFFVFFLVPKLISFFFTFIDKEAIFVEEDTVPPQMPVLSNNPAEATFSANLNLHGFAEPKSKVIFLVNSTKSAEVEVAEDGQFEHKLALVEGLNELSIFSTDGVGNESLSTRSYAITRDSQVPNLEIESPTDGSVIELKKNRTTTIKGTTEPGAKVFINDRLVLADEEGNFSTNYYLAEGKNELNFVVTDKATNKTERKIEVEFKL